MAFRQQIHSWRNPDLVIRFREVGLLVEALDSRPDVDAGTRQQARAWLADARNILQQRFFGVLPYDRYDAVWAIVNQLRHLLCGALQPTDLLALLADIRASASYLSGQQRVACERDLGRIELDLLSRVAAASSVADAALQQLRARLEAWSRLVAGEREAHWRKINLLRKRLAVTGWLLFVLLLAALCLLPGLMVGAGSSCPQPPSCSSGVAVGSVQLGGIMLLGAIGGLVSALWSKESVQATPSQFYVQRSLLTLKPVIGAATATFVVLLQKAGIVSLLPAGSDEMTAYLVLAFLSGFSERFVRTRIEEASSPGGSPVGAAAEPRDRQQSQD